MSSLFSALEQIDAFSHSRPLSGSHSQIPRDHAGPLRRKWPPLGRQCWASRGEEQNFVLSHLFVKDETGATLLETSALLVVTRRI